MRDLPPHARAEAQRLLDDAAPVLLEKRLEADALGDRGAPGADGDRGEREA